jgi:transcriptional regulator with XRE-family HTH domain
LSRILTTVGERIKEYRKKSGLSQEDIAKRVGVSRSLIAQIETNLSNPSLEFLSNFVRIANTTYNYIIEGVEDANLNANLNANLSTFNEPESTYGSEKIKEIELENMRLKAENEALYKAFRELGSSNSKKSKSA